MFKNQTVFVLGAGASWHYGYPTGEKLVDGVIDAANRFAQYCGNRLQCGQVVQLIPAYVSKRIDSSQGSAGASEGWRHVQQECRLLNERLEAVRPLLIDHFLAWNETLRPIGKLMIAAAILECEAIRLRIRANQNRQPSGSYVLGSFVPVECHDYWYRFIIHKLVYGCGSSADLLENKVRFITFNYDTSLEYHLFKALTAVDLIKRGHAEKFLDDDRIVHIYGSVHVGVPLDQDTIDLDVALSLGEKFSEPLNFAGEFETRKVLLDRCLAASENLRTIDPQDKEEEREALAKARKWLPEASVIYILGFGFDYQNARRIGLDEGTLGEKAVMFTNFGDLNTINKKASKLFLRDSPSFLKEVSIGNPKGRYFEKSTRTVYEALEKDFDALESELVAGSKI